MSDLVYYFLEIFSCFMVSLCIFMMFDVHCSLYVWQMILIHAILHSKGCVCIVDGVGKSKRRCHNFFKSHSQSNHRWSCSRVQGINTLVHKYLIHRYLFKMVKIKNITNFFWLFEITMSFIWFNTKPINHQKHDDY